MQSDDLLRQQEATKFENDLHLNGYKKAFIDRIHNKTHEVKITQLEENNRSYAVLPYIRRVSERTKGSVNRAKVKVAFRQLELLAKIFQLPKDKRD